MSPGVPPRDHLRSIVEDGVKAAMPARCLASWIGIHHGRIHVAGEDRTPDPGGRLVVLAAGKAAFGMVEATLTALPGRVDELVVAASVPEPRDLALPEATRWYVAEHPVPGAGSAVAARALLDAARRCAPVDRVVVLLSGGASAMACLPVAGISAADKAQAHAALVSSAAPIRDINAVRKHLSALKGGALAAVSAAGSIDVLLISDVVGDAPDTIGSGPFAADPTTFEDAREVLAVRGLWNRVPESVRRHLERGCAGQVAETPKPGDRRLGRVRHHVVASSTNSLAASRETAERLGYRCRTVRGAAEGPTERVAGRIADAIRARLPSDPPACLLSAGENEVEVRGSGLGGRCQELSLVLAFELAGHATASWLVAGSDGRDGPGHAAGAYADGGTVARARRLGLDPRAALAKNDTTRLFEGLGDLYVTGPTGTNVMDLRAALVGSTAT